MKKILVSFSLVSLLACNKSGSNQGPGDNPGPGPDPNVSLAITAVSPDNTETGPVTITRTGFHPTSQMNEVWFGNFPAQVKTGNSTQLVVDLPLNIHPGDYDLIIKTNNKTATKVKGIHIAGWTVNTFAGTGAFGSDDGAANTASFRQPIGLALDAAGNLFLADGNKIRGISPQGVVNTIAGANGSGAVDAKGTNARFNNITSIVLDAAGNMYVADQFNHQIRMCTPDGNVTTIAGKAGILGYKDGTGTEAEFALPYGLAINKAGTHLFVGDYGNHRIRKIEIATKKVITIAGNGTSTSSDNNGLNAGIPNPGSMLFDADGNLFITEKGGGRVRKMLPNGDLSTIGGNLSVNTSPTHIAIDQEKNVYVSYSGIGKIKRYDPSNQETNFAGNNMGTGDEDGGAQIIFFQRPEGIVVTQDNNGNKTFYIADSQRKKIKRIRRI